MEEQKKKSNRGRKKKNQEDLVTRLPVFAMKKNHEKILAKVEPIIKKMDK